MIWQPPDLTAACAVNSTLHACSPFGLVYLNLLVQLFGGSIDKGIHDSGDQDEYDFIVVGAGSAGCVVANRLSENPNWKVLLLEAGPEQPDVTRVPGIGTVVVGTNVGWPYQTQPNGKSCLAYPGEKCFWESGKMMGGSSSMNGMAYIRGSKVDYDVWAALGNEGWSYEDVLPFFIKSEKNMNIEDLDSTYHGAAGEQYVSSYSYVDKPSLMVTEAFREAGLPLVDYNGPQLEGTAQAQSTAYAGQRISTNTAFIRPIRYIRKNLTVKTNSEALQILIDENKKAYGIIYNQNGNKFTAFAKKEVIVSAGAMRSPKLLMLSGIGPKDHLEKMGIKVIHDLAVGENLHDHVSFNGVIIALPNKTSTRVSDDEVLETIQDYAEMKIKRGPLTAPGPMSSMAFIKTEPDLIAPDIQYHFMPVNDVREYVDDISAAQIFPAAFYDGLLPKTMNLVPKSRGVLLLNESDPTGTPLIYPNYLGDEEDIIPLLKGVRFLLSLEDTKAFRSRGAYFVRKPLPACRDYEWGTDEYYICLAKAYTSSTFHPVGTCKMGPKSDDKAVVDNELRVYGIDGLRVIDASIMPVVVRGNTNAPSIMIGERGVDFIIKYWQANKEDSNN